MRAEQSAIGILLGCLAWALLLPLTRGADPPGKDDPPEEPKKLNDLFFRAPNAKVSDGWPSRNFRISKRVPG